MRRAISPRSFATCAKDVMDDVTSRQLLLILMLSKM
jgi:hypothetical protein